MNTNKYNIYEAYLYRFKKFILAFSYTPGFDIKFLIDDMQHTFNLNVIRLDGSSYLRSDSVFNYDKLNADIEKILEEKKDISLTTTSYGTGILIYGLNFPSKLLKFQIDIHLHFALSANLFLKTDSNSTLEEYNNFKILLADNKIHKYFNIKSNKSIDINNSVFDKIIDYLEFKVYDKDYKIYSTKSMKENKFKPIPETKKKISTIDSKQKFTTDEIDILTIDSALSDAENDDSNTDTDTNINTDTNIDLDLDTTLEMDTDLNLDIDLDIDIDLDTDTDN